MTRTIIVKILKVCAGIAAIVWLLVPLSTSNGMPVFFASVGVIVLCLVVSSELDNGQGASLSLWPRKPKK